MTNNSDRIAELEAALQEAQQQLATEKQRVERLETALEQIAKACDDAFSDRTPYTAALNRIASIFKEATLSDTKDAPVSEENDGPR